MFQIPKNVIQIGQSQPHLKIYVEDYVHTFLKQTKNDEVYLMFGKKEEVDGVLYYLVYGAEKKTDWDRGSLPYFKKYDRLGTLEKKGQKQIFKPIRQEAVNLENYFVFYEQNEDMQSYMITVREREDQQKERETEKEAVLEAVRSRREQYLEKQNMHKKAAETPKAAKMPKPEDAVQSRDRNRKIKQARRKMVSQRKLPVRKRNLKAAGILMAAFLLAVGAIAVQKTERYVSAVHLIGEKFAALQKRVEMPKEDTAEIIIEETQFLTELEPETETAAEIVTETEQQTAFEETEEENTASIVWTIGEEENAAAIGETEPEQLFALEQPESTETAEESMVSALAEVPESYEVKRGDSLAEICRRFYGDTSRLYEICRLNNIADPNQIQYGQNILLP